MGPTSAVGRRNKVENSWSGQWVTNQFVTKKLGGVGRDWADSPWLGR